MSYRRRKAIQRLQRACVEHLESRQLLSASYTVTDLGAPGGKHGQSFATDINNSGQVVGYYKSSSASSSHAFLYAGGNLQNIGSNDDDSQAWSINDSGQIVGKDGDAFLYSNGALTSIGRLPGGNTSFAYAVNNSGQIAGDSLTSDESITHAFLYYNGAMHDLGTLGGAQSNAFAINNRADVAGLAYAPDGVSHAFLYADGRMIDIGQLWGSAASMARGVNDSDQVVGYGYFTGQPQRHAFLYSGGAITDLQTLGGISSAAMGINASGQIVGDSNDGAGDDHAFIYTNGAMQDLNGLVPATAGWDLQQATAINDNGQIVGTGIIGGRQHAFLLTPVATPPAPGSISGAVFNDINSNHAQDAGETGLGGWTVFVDTNGNGSLDPGEPQATTKPDGAYSIAGLTAGNYTVSEVVKSGFTQTAPTGGTSSVHVAAGANSVVSSFGDVATPTLPKDTAPPTASIAATNITSAGGTSASITVVYTDNVAVNASSVDVNDITVTGPNGPLTVTAASAGSGNKSTVAATYTVSAPGGSWDSADGGSYVISVRAHQVSDTSGNFAGAASGSFSVNIPVAAPSTGSDPTFASGKGVGTNFVTEAVVSQPDGKVLAVGREGDLSAGTSQAVIERINANGTLDTTFGANGMIINPAGKDDAYYAILMQDASHFVVAGTSSGDFVLARYSISGKLDATFGNGGKIFSDFGTSSDAARGLALTSTGMIVAGGDSGANLAFARYDGSGHPDANFAQNGQQLYGLGDGTSNGVGTIAVDGSGRIVAVGAEGASVVVVRLTAAGEADGTFGDGGLVTVPSLVARTDLGGPDRSEGLAIQSDGQILVANRTSGGHFGLVRLNDTGAVDSTFGINGLVTSSFGGDDDADSVLVRPNGAIVVIGTSLVSGTASAAVGIFDPSVAPITSFGTNGQLTLPSGATTPSTLGAKNVIRPSALHTGDLILKAFGTVTPDGRVIVGTSNDAVAATTSSTLRRPIIPGAQLAGVPDGAPVGTIGISNGKNKPLNVTDSDGTKITFTLIGGTGSVYQSGDTFNISINDSGKGVTLRITGRGGDKRVTIGSIQVSGTLRTFSAPNSDLTGLLHVTGAIGTMTVGDVRGRIWSGAGIANMSARDFSGTLFATSALGRLRFRDIRGTIASGSGAIASITGASMTASHILSGAQLGADGVEGGTGANADTYGAGAISLIRITGEIATSTIRAGVNPGGDTLSDQDDSLIGTAAADLIRTVHAKSIDLATLFEAGSFGKMFLPKLTSVTGNPDFKMLSAS